MDNCVIVDNEDIAWRNKVGERYKDTDGFVRSFISNSLIHAWKLKKSNHKEYLIFLEFIEHRVQFTKSLKSVIISYIKTIDENLDEKSIKEKFKLFENIGRERRKKIRNAINHKIDSIERKRTQLVETEETIDTLKATNENVRKELALVKRQLEQLKLQHNKLNSDHNDLINNFVYLSKQNILLNNELQDLKNNNN
jgi:chromosome segregation ATPase